MESIANLYPKDVFRYFKEVSDVPRSSKNNDKISEYLVNFAKNHALEYYQDKSGNVIIYKGATPGYENAEPIMIQGHMDMVAAVAEGSNHDFKNDPLDLYVDGDFLKARNTTLGADDGIAIAMALAILDSSDIPHPALEVVVTTDEEIGMIGAGELDGSKISARKILNIDSEEEGVLTVGCAGAVDVSVAIHTPRVDVSGVKYNIVIDGLLGGHSGNDIDKERGNAVNIAGRMLFEAAEKAKFNIVSLEGGYVTNAICNKVEGSIIVNTANKAAFESEIVASKNIIKNEYRTSDPGLDIRIENMGEVCELAIDEDSQRNVLGYLLTVPSGVQNRSVEIENLTETSLSIGIIRLDGDTMITKSMIRSSVNSRRDALADKIVTLAAAFGGQCEFRGEYGAWEFNENSKLLDICKDVFEKQYGHQPEVGAVHAGVECGKWAEKLGEIDAVSLGPDMLEVHSINERLSISSTLRTWEYVKNILAACK